MKRASIIVGLGFGDEGKGLVSDYLCSTADKPIVIRFNGGHQAGHTVVTETGDRHHFSHFGSGSLRGVPTYWSRYCTFSPEDFLFELLQLKSSVKFFLDKLSPITTHYDILFNRAIEATRGHKKIGSCGSGFSSTLERHCDNKISFFAFDLLNQKTLRKKLNQIRTYYQDKVDRETRFDFDQFDHDAEDGKFIEHVKDLKVLLRKGILTFKEEQEILSNESEWQHYIFEGAQGILLDMDHGKRPYITKSNTTSRNAVEMIGRHKKELSVTFEIFYVTRAYHTRHGAGPFKIYNPKLRLRNIESESNKFNEFQGKFRFTHLNIDLVNYALKCDVIYSKDPVRHLVVTCLDQIISPKLEVYKNDRKLRMFPRELTNHLKIDFTNTYFSYGPCSKDLVFRERR